MFCSQPFYYIEIYEKGDVYTCCPPFINNYSIGNIFETPFDDIWNGEKAKELRRKMLSSDFSLCNNICNRKFQNNEENQNYTEIVSDYPTEISISSDNTCNIKCKFCRDEAFSTKYDKTKLDDEIENIWLPIFKNAKILRFGCSGEPFASYKERLIIKKSVEKYPNLKFHFHTNGILANEKLLKELNVYNKIDTMTVSMHSASRWTYNKIIVGGKYDKVISNLKLYSKMKQEGLINHFRMIFVVYSENYKDMPKFVKLAQKFNAIPEFWALRLVENTKIGREFEKYSIIDKNHKKHKDFIKMINKPIFKSENIRLYPEIKELIK
jgi:radical SAM protein with 4Fe4S-binding SPASM domain